MADEIKGLSIGLGLDTAGIDQSLKQLRPKLTQVNSEMKANMSAFDRSEKSVGKYQTQLTGLNKKLDLQKAAVNAARAEYDRMVAAHGEGSTQANKAATAYNNLAADMNNLERHVENLTQEMREFEEQQRIAGSGWTRMGEGLTNAGAKMTKFGDGMKSVGTSLSKYVTAPIVGIGAAGTLAANTMDEAYKTIRNGTGATGDSLEDLKDSFKTVFTNVPESADEVSTALADLNTRTGLLGPELEAMTEQFLTLGRVSGEDVPTLIAKGTRAFGDWGIEVDQQGETMDYFWKVAQSTGIGVSDLMTKVVQFGAPLRQMGFDFETSAALLGKFEKEGVNAELVMGSMRQALGRMAKDGIDAETGLLKTMEAVKGAGSASEANAAAIELFGARAGPDMAAAIREGRFEIDDLIDSLQSSGETIAQAGEDTVLFSDRMAEMKNKVTAALEPIGRMILDIAEQWLPKLETGLTKVVTWFDELGESGQRNVFMFGGLVAAAGPVLVVAGQLLSGLGGLVTTVGGLATAIGAKGGLMVVLGKAGTAMAAFATGPVGLTIAAVAALTAGGIALGKYLSGDMLEEVDVFGEGLEGVSDSTKKALEAFWELGDGVDDALMEMRVSGDGLTQEYADTIVGNFDQMNEQLLTKMNENHEEQRTAMLSMFEGTRHLTDEERENILNRMDTHHTIETEKQQAQMDRINEIYETALAEQRDTTEAENIEINAIKTQMQNEAVEQLSESAIEEAAIRQRLKDTSERITTEQGVELIKRSAEHRDEKIRIAEDEYDQQVAVLEHQFREVGSITEEEYETLLAKAKQQRDDQVNEANGMHNEIIEETTAGNKEVERMMDVHTGEMLSKWDYLSRESAKKLATLTANGVTEWTKYKNSALDLLTIMSRDGTKYISGMVDAAAAMPGKMARGIKAASGAATSAVIAMGNDMLRKFGGIVNALILGVNAITSKLGIKANISLWSIPTIPGGGSGGSSGNARPVRAYHSGTDGHPGGPMIVGDKYGRELVQFPDGRMWMSPDTDTLVPDAPKGTRVIPNKLTEKLVKGEIPMYANGVGVGLLRGIATAGAKGQSWLNNVWDYASNPKGLIDLMVRSLGLSITGLSGGMADLAKGAFNTVKDKSVEYVKSMFAKAGDVTGGSFGPGFRLTSRAGWRIHPIYGDRRFHFGDDWGAAHGTNIKSMSSGVVKSSRFEKFRGNTVRVQSGPYELVYQHNSRNNVRAGQSITKGQSVGAVGSTGDSTGPHLHFETWKNGRFVYPQSLGFKTGAVFNGPTAGLMAEDGHPEVLIPTDPKRRTDAMKLLAVVGKMLGADGSNATRPNQLPPLPGGQGNGVMEELLAATLKQNQILMQILNKNSDVYLDTGVLAGAMTPQVSQNQGSNYDLNKLMRGR